MQQRPPSLLGAAGVQAADALIVLAASVLAGADTVAGKSYQRGSGIALTLIGLATAAALAWIALGLFRGHRWSRTPAALTQLFVGIVGIYLVQGHRYAWGIPSLVLAAAGFALLLMPSSLRALAGPGPGDAPGGGQPSAPAPGQRSSSSQPPRQAKPPAKTPAAAKTSAAAKAPAAGKARPPGKRPARG